MFIIRGILLILLIVAGVTSDESLERQRSGVGRQASVAGGNGSGTEIRDTTDRSYATW